MPALKLLFGLILALMVITVYYGRKYSNPYKLVFVFGKKGVGKSTLLTKLAYQYSRNGWNVYSTEPTLNARTFNPRNFGTFRFPENSVVLIDEVSLLWGNREFKSFSKDVEKQFRLQRHDKLKIYLFSQTFDVDLKIRNLADSMYLATKMFNCVTWLRQIDKHVVLTKSDSSGASKIAEDLSFEPLIFFWLGTRKLVWIPRWAKMFNSYDDMGWQRADMPYEQNSSARPSLLPGLPSRIRPKGVDGEADGEQDPLAGDPPVDPIS